MMEPLQPVIRIMVEACMYCNHCGKELESDQKFCSACGKPVTASSPPAPVQGRVARHVRLLGIFWIVFGALRLLRGSGRVFGAGIVRSIGHDWLDGWAWGWPVGDFVSHALYFAGMVALATAVAALAAGWGLLERRPWARTLAIVMAVISLFSPVLGTALGIYTLWVLLSAESEAEYRRIGSAI